MQPPQAWVIAQVDEDDGDGAGKLMLLTWSGSVLLVWWRYNRDVLPLIPRQWRQKTWWLQLPWGTTLCFKLGGAPLRYPSANSPAMVPENLSWWQQSMLFVGTPSAECYSNRVFPTRVTRGFISNSQGIRCWKLILLVLVKRPEKQNKLSCAPNSTKWLSSTRFRISNNTSMIKINK